MIIYEYNHCFWKLAASKSLQSHIAKSVTVRFCGSGPSAKDLEGCPWDALHSGLALGFSWLWCSCTTAEGASAIPKENRASGCCRKQIPTCSSLYSITAGRLEAFVKVEETEWGVAVCDMMEVLELWSVGKKKCFITRSHWKLVPLIGKGSEFSCVRRPCRKIQDCVQQGIAA